MDGIIIINKEKGYTSNDVVQIVKKLFKEKVGHTGTLDPMATGVLPLLIGKGTHLSKYLINHDKIYKATLKLGQKMDTGDIEGKVVEEKEVTLQMLEEDYINDILNSFIGEQIQTPPIYSAIKVKGKKLYEYARNGQEIEIPTRKITIYKMELIEINTETKEIKLEVSCSKGTYIRTLCEDIAKKIGTVGYMSDLNRIQVGNFNIQSAIKIDDLKIDSLKNFISIEDFFKENSKIILDSNDITRFLNGAKLLNEKQNGLYCIYNTNNDFIGVGTVKDGVLKRDIVV